jgi:hypothetical protein
MTEKTYYAGVPEIDTVHVQWAVDQWRAQVEKRPLRNVHRRALDDVWRQVIRHFGGDADMLLPLPCHDEMVAENPQAAIRNDEA